MWFPKDVKVDKNKVYIYRDEKQKIMIDSSIVFMRIFDGMPNIKEEEKKEIILFKTIEI